MEEFDVLGGGTAVAEQGSTGADSGSLVFDLSEVKEDMGFELIPKGTYPAIVDEMEFGESSTGNPMMTVKYKITEGEFENRVLFDYWVLRGNGSDFGLAKLKKFLTRVMPHISLSDFNPADFADSGDAVNQELSVTVRIQTQKKGEYKGEKRNQVSDIGAPSNDSFI